MDEQNRSKKEILAWYILGSYIVDNNGSKREINEAMTELKKDAENGNHEAEYRLGNCYFHGFEVEQSYEIAFNWYKRASDTNGDKAEIAALIKIAFCYEMGLGVEQNYWLAYEYFNLASNKAYSWFEYCQLEELFDGWLTIDNISEDSSSLKNIEKKELCYTQAVQAGIKEAEPKLKLVLEEKEKIRSKEESVEQVKTNSKLEFDEKLKLAKEGNADAQCFIAQTYTYGNNVVEKDYEKGFERALL